jgi:hypothetical protein
MFETTTGRLASGSDLGDRVKHAGTDMRDDVPRGDRPDGEKAFKGR